MPTPTKSRNPTIGHQWQNLLGGDNRVLSGTPEPTMVGFRDLVGVALVQFQKNWLLREFSSSSYLGQTQGMPGNSKSIYEVCWSQKWKIRSYVLFRGHPFTL